MTTATELAERRARVAAMTRCGMSAPQIASVLRVTKRTVTRDRTAIGCNRGAPSVPLTDDERRRAATLLDEGCSYVEAARTIGRGHKALRKAFPGHTWTHQQCGQQAAIVRYFNRLGVSA